MRRITATCAAASVLIGAAVALASQPATSPEAVSGLAPNEVLSVSGGDLKVQGLPVSSGFYVPYDTLVRLSAGGRAVVRLDGVGGIMVYGPAEFQLLNGKRPGVSVRRGAVLMTLDAPGRSYFIATPAIVAAAKDGAFYVDALGKLESYVCACDASVDVYDRGSRKPRRLASKPHEAYDFKRVYEGQVDQIEVPSEGHSDADIAELRAALKKQN